MLQTLDALRRGGGAWRIGWCWGCRNVSSALDSQLFYFLFMSQTFLGLNTSALTLNFTKFHIKTNEIVYSLKPFQSNSTVNSFTFKLINSAFSQIGF